MNPKSLENLSRPAQEETCFVDVFQDVCDSKGAVIEVDDLVALPVEDCADVVSIEDIVFSRNCRGVAKLLATVGEEAQLISPRVVRKIDPRWFKHKLETEQ